jgi:predicted alpha/beta superfamily hydrolase
MLKFFKKIMALSNSASAQVALFGLTLCCCFLVACTARGPIDGPTASPSNGQSDSSALRTVVVRAAVPDGLTTAVYLTGNIPELGPWNPAALVMQGSGRERSATLKIPNGTAFEFKLTLGSWDREALAASGMVMANQKALIRADQEIQVNVVDFKKDSAAYLHDWRASGVLGTLVYWRDVSSKNLAYARNVSIWLPPDYQSQSSKRYRVIYMSDGQNLFDPRIANTGVDWGVDEAMMRLSDAAAIEPAIVVAAWSSPARGLEYSPWHDAPKYARFLIEELMPRINSEFRTQSGPKNTFHMGSSMGGLLSFYLITHHPEVFGACGCLSTHFPLSEAIAAKYFPGAPVKTADTTPYIECDIANGLRLPKGLRMWFDYGTVGLDASYGPSHAHVRQWLLAQGYVENQDFVMRTIAGADHNESAWRARLDAPLRFLLER